MGETGVLKKSTDDTITTTRLTQLPTEWVTGDTRCNIMYETCGQYHFSITIHTLIIIIIIIILSKRKFPNVYLLICMEADSCKYRLGVNFINIQPLNI